MDTGRSRFLSRFRRLSVGCLLRQRVSCHQHASQDSQDSVILPLIDDEEVLQLRA